MARNRIHIVASPEQVFAVLADPCRYAEWVVGAATVRDADDDFPAPGSRFHHRVGMRPFTLADHTEVAAVDPPWRIELKAKARPLGTADIALELSERNGGTEVLMVEGPGDRLSALVADNPLADALLRIRNAEALGRLKRVVEERPLGEPRRRLELQGLRVLVTGGSSGIGLASAERLADAGAELCLLARGEPGLAAAAERLRGASVHTIAVDVRDREALGAAIERAAGLMGGIDVLLTAAAAASFGPFAETDPEDFEATLAVVLGGTANAIRAALPELERSRGAVVAIGSTTADLPLPNLAAYTAAKHAVAGLLDTLRIELADASAPVSISLVNPGAVDTPFWDHLESQTGLLPPVPPEIYSPEAVAEAVVAVIRRPREELTVGGSSRLQIALFRHLRGPTEAAFTLLAALAQGGDERRAGDVGGLRNSLADGEPGAGHGGRPSLAVVAQRGWESLRRRAPLL
jgi:short-subunit dehydrogenase/uncharacterized protein YndB with AHSA1/START domain